MSCRAAVARGPATPLPAVEWCARDTASLPDIQLSLLCSAQKDKVSEARWTLSLTLQACRGNIHRAQVWETGPVSGSWTQRGSPQG